MRAFKKLASRPSTQTVKAPCPKHYVQCKIECESSLAELIPKMKAEIKAQEEALKSKLKFAPL